MSAPLSKRLEHRETPEYPPSPPYSSPTASATGRFVSLSCLSRPQDGGADADLQSRGLASAAAGIGRGRPKTVANPPCPLLPLPNDSHPGHGRVVGWLGFRPCRR